MKTNRLSRKLQPAETPSYDPPATTETNEENFSTCVDAYLTGYLHK